MGTKRAEAPEGASAMRRRVCVFRVMWRASGRDVTRLDPDPLQTWASNTRAQAGLNVTVTRGAACLGANDAQRAPWNAVEDAGGTAELISLEPGVVQAFNHLDRGDTFSVDHIAAEADRQAAGARRC